MEPAQAGTPHGVSLSQSPSPSRKQWRAVSENASRNVGSEVQQGRELSDVVDFCSIQIDGVVGVDEGMMQQRIHSLARQREEMQQMEIELRAQLIARAEIVEMQNSYDARFKEQAGAVSRLQEQLHETEQTIQELERKLEEKERELHAVRLDNEAAWAKEDLLREQNKELASYRRERDNIEAERSHHRQQIHELQEHIQDKERQLLELQDQHRVAQETLLFKDEQIRDAQTWITRVQEMDVLQSSTLQAELRERTDQYNQLWLGCQRQFAEMERLHMQTIQQLQLELGGRGKIAYNGESSLSQNVSADGSQVIPNSGNHVEANGGGTPKASSGGLSNGNAENSQQYVSSDSSSAQANHAATFPVTPSIVGMPSYFPPGQVAAVHSYVMHQQGASQPVPTQVPISQVNQFHSVPAMGSFQQWPNQQAVSEGLSMSSQNQYSLSQAEENSARSESNYSYEFPINGPGLHADYLNTGMSHRLDPNSQISSGEEAQTLESVERGYFVGSEAQHNLQQISSQFHEALRLEPLNQTGEIQVHENDSGNVVDCEPANHDLTTEQPTCAASPSPSQSSAQHDVTEASLNSAADAVIPYEQSKSITSGKTLESALLDERALLACIVRTIPPGGKIRISSTLPNRLGKMLAPLHWHDYKRRYGRLDDFVAGHPELFAIEGDYIQLREGAQGIIAATAAVAKAAAAAAAAAASSPYSSFFPPVAVTPMADAGRTKPVRPINSSHLPSIHNNHSNGSGFNLSGSISNVKILSKSKDPLELNGHTGHGQPVLVSTENGLYSDRSGQGNPQSKVQIQARAGANFIAKQQGRTTAAAAAVSRR